VIPSRTNCQHGQWKIFGLWGQARAGPIPTRGVRMARTPPDHYRALQDRRARRHGLHHGLPYGREPAARKGPSMVPLAYIEETVWDPSKFRRLRASKGGSKVLSRPPRNLKPAEGGKRTGERTGAPGAGTEKGQRVRKCGGSSATNRNAMYEVFSFMTLHIYASTLRACTMPVVFVSLIPINNSQASSRVQQYTHESRFLTPQQVFGAAPCGKKPVSALW
jgi:hypothetical protein